MTFRRLFFIGLFFIGCSSPSNEQGQPPPRSQNKKKQEKLYHGKPLSVWKRRLKNFDPKDKANRTAVKGLLELIQDDSVPWYTRKMAALAMARMGEPAKEALPILIHLSENKSHSEEIQQWASKAIAQFGVVAVEYTPTLIARLHSEETPVIVRLICIDALSRIGNAHPKVLPALIATIKKKENSALVRAGAIEALIFLGSSAAPATPALIKALTDSNESIRSKSALAIAAIGPSAQSAIDILSEVMLFDDSSTVRKNASVALARIGLPAHPMLFRLMKDRDPKVRQLAVSAFSNIKQLDQSIQKKISLLLNDSNDSVQMTAIEILSAHLPNRNEQKKLVTLAISLLQSEERNVRKRTIVFVSQKNYVFLKTLLPSINQTLNSPRPEVRSAGRELIKRIEKSQSPNLQKTD